MAQQQQPNREDRHEYQTFSTKKAVFSVAALAVVGYFVSKYMKTAEKEKAADAVSDNRNAQIALALKGAIYNIGISTWFATFDQDKVFALADAITSLKEVRKYYRIYHNRDLDADLTEQATAEEFIEFMRRANKKKTESEADEAIVQSASPTTDYSQTPNTAPNTDYSGKYREDWVGKLATLVSPANIRTEPKKGDNILVPMKDVRKQSILGLLTGKISDNGYVEIFVRFDTENSGSSHFAYRNVIKPVSFYNVFTTDYRKEIKEKGILVYVHKDYIEDGSKYGIKGSQAGYSDDTSKIGISLKGINPTVYVKRGHYAPIYDKAMKQKGIADERHCLGAHIGTLTTPQGDIYEFRNTQGKNRWVHAKHTTIQ